MLYGLPAAPRLYQCIARARPGGRHPPLVGSFTAPLMSA
jgi:hypothetical protein